MAEQRLYFRQLLSGRDHAVGDPMARQMVNFSYLIGDRASGEAVLVDPAYDTAGLLEILAEDDMHPVGVLATHYHADHIGGSIMGHSIDGIAELLEQVDVPVHVQRDEVPWVERSTSVTSQLAPHDSGDVVRVGEVEITLIHTPGHTPGSQCFFVDGRLVSGDTLFRGGPGATGRSYSDFPTIIDSIRDRLLTLPAATRVLTGHGDETTIGDEAPHLDEWIRDHG